jgi:uncharacterized repeat protein (TIGR01451 family)
MMSDWGSVFPGQEVAYTIILRNDQSATLEDVTIGSMLPGNLKVLGAAANRGSDPSVTGNDMQYSISTIKPGEVVEITIQTEVKPDIARGTRLVAQSQLDFQGGPPSLLSNIVTVMVLDDEERVAAAPVSSPYAQAPTDTPAPTKTPAATNTPAPTDTPEPTGTSGATDAPTATNKPTQSAEAVAAVPKTSPQPTPASSRAAEPATAPLPATSSGVPLVGLALLGLTLMIRTVRLHRARERI